MADKEKLRAKLAGDQATLAAFMRGVEGHIPIQTTKGRAVEEMARYHSAEEVRAEVEQREHAKPVKEYRADQARKDDIRCGFGLLLWLVAVILLGYSIYAGASVTWKVRAADMTTQIRWEAFLATLPGLILGLVAGRLGWYLIQKQ